MTRGYRGNPGLPVLLGGSGLWDEQDGFYYDRLHAPHGATAPARLRSAVGLIPLVAVEVLPEDVIELLPGFRKRLEWFLSNRQDLARHLTYCERCEGQAKRLLAITAGNPINAPAPTICVQALLEACSTNRATFPLRIR